MGHGEHRSSDVVFEYVSGSHGAHSSSAAADGGRTPYPGWHSSTLMSVLNSVPSSPSRVCASTTFTPTEVPGTFPARTASDTCPNETVADDSAIVVEPLSAYTSPSAAISRPRTSTIRASCTICPNPSCASSVALPGSRSPNRTPDETAEGKDRRGTRW